MEYPEKSFKSFSRNAGRQGVCEQAEGFEGKIRRFGM